MTLHTGAGCTITNNGMFSGTLGTTNCDINAAGQATNAGCQINSPSTASFGTGFNAGQGGVYATEWTSDAISIWFFPRSAIPSDITSGSPDPTTWGSATASFSGGCDIDQFFMNNQIVFDTTFCGDWAGNVWSTDPVCSAKASTCQDYVQNNPSDFADAYWSINSLKVYTSNGASSTPAASSAAESSAVSVSIPATVAPSGSIPAPIPTSFATQPSGVPAGVSSAPGEQSFSYSRGGGGGHSITWNGNTVTDTPIAAPSSTDAVEVSSISSPVETATSTAVAADQASTSTSASIQPGIFVTENPSSSPTTVAAASTSPSTSPTTTPAPSSSSEAPDQPPPGVQWVTVSALQTDQFPDPGQTQTRGTNAKRSAVPVAEAPEKRKPVPAAENGRGLGVEVQHEQRRSSSIFGSEVSSPPSIINDSSSDPDPERRAPALDLEVAGIEMEVEKEKNKRSSTFGSEVGGGAEAAHLNRHRHVARHAAHRHGKGFVF